jgi:hypothetical protein
MTAIDLPLNIAIAGPFAGNGECKVSAGDGAPAPSIID